MTELIARFVAHTTPYSGSLNALTIGFGGPCWNMVVPIMRLQDADRGERIFQDLLGNRSIQHMVADLNDRVVLTLHNVLPITESVYACQLGWYDAWDKLIEHLSLHGDDSFRYFSSSADAAPDRLSMPTTLYEPLAGETHDQRLNPRILQRGTVPPPFHLKLAQLECRRLATQDQIAA